MRFTARLPDGQKVIVDKAFWTGKTELRLDNVIIGKMGFKRQEKFHFKDKNQKENTLELRHPLLDPMPIVLLNGKDLFESKRFSKVQTAIICIPLVLILQLGFIPALIGVGSVYLNFFIARKNDLPSGLRWTAIAFVPLIGLLLVVISSGVIWETIGKEKKHKSGHHIKTQAPTHKYDPREDEMDPRQWARPNPRAEEMERYVEEGR